MYIVPAVGVIFALIASFVFSPPAYSQSREFLRLRSTAAGSPTESNPLAGGEPIPQYYISVGDKLEVFVWQNPDISRETVIRPDGKLSYPLVGTIKAAGLTIDELQRRIIARLARYIRHPVVTVSVKEAAGSKILVLGQVNYPGAYSFNGSISVLDAIALAGDFTPDGRRTSVMIISDNLTPDPKVRRLDALTAIRKGFSGREALLKPNDVVYVPRSTIADFNKFLNELAPTINTASSLFMTGHNLSQVAVDARAWFMHRDVKVIRGD